MEKQQLPEPIAIIGMACRLPGGINNPKDLWSLTVDRKSTETEIPPDRFHKDAFLSMDHARPGEVAISHGHFLQRDLRNFDYRFFGLTKELAEAMDPQHRQLLEVVFECFESGGNTIDKVKGTNVGCFCGAFTSDYHDIAMRDPENIPTYMAIGTVRSMLANQISQAFDLRGPSISVDTACSTSLVSLHLACRAIKMGDCDSAIVGATNLFLSPEMAVAMDKFGTLATDGQTMTFDADAHGYGRAEAVSAIYVKKLGSALKDGDDIRAVIRSTSTNSDGGSTSMTVPSAIAQYEAIRHAYDEAGIKDLNETGYFECHGTGTTVGDPIEVSAVSKTFGPTRADDDFLCIGSTKPNIGHSEAASGLSSIIKVVQCLEQGKIPPTANFKTPNPQINFSAGKVRVPVKLELWPEKSLRRASINSFGIGGSNAHVIMEAFEVRQAGDDNTTINCVTGPRRPYLIFISAGSRASLESNVSTLLAFLRGQNADTISLVNLAEVLNMRRTKLQYMHFVAAYSTQEMEKTLEASNFERTPAAVMRRKPRLLFVFTGQGATWSQMGRVLMDTFPVAHDVLTALDAIIQDLQVGTKWSLIENLRRELSRSEVIPPQIAQPLTTAVQIALVDILASWNVRPDIVVGHSSGETAAAYAAGAITSREAIINSYFRGIAAAKAKPGSMLAVGCASDDGRLQAIMEKHGVSISCFNSSQNLTLGGSEAAIDAISRELDQLGISCARLSVPRAYHTTLMEQAAAAYYKLLDGQARPKNADIPLYSAALGRKIQGDELRAKYWEMHLRNPVLFEEAIRNIFRLEGNIDVIVEIGPHRALSRPVNEVQALHASNQKRPYLSTMIRNTDTAINMMRLAGSLVLNGVDVNLRAANGVKTPTQYEMQELHRLSRNLPTYSWDYSSQVWSESRLSETWRFRKVPQHELLGSKVPGCNPLAPTWRHVLKYNKIPWLLDHKIHNSAVFPLSAYLAMAIEAVIQTKENKQKIDWESSNIEIKDFVVSRSIVLEEDEEVEIMLMLHAIHPHSRLSGQWYGFEIISVTDDVATSHCKGRAGVFSDHETGDVSHASLSEFPLKVPIKAFYQTLAKTGIRYGPSFRLLRAAHSRPGSLACSATIDSSWHMGRSRGDQQYVIHPRVLDAILQSIFVAQCSGRYQDLNMSLIAAGISELKLRPLQRNSPTLHCSTTVRPHSLGRFIGNIECFNQQGISLLSLADVQFARTTSTGAAPVSSLWMQHIWRPDIDTFLQSGHKPPSSMVKFGVSPQLTLDFERLVRLLSQQVIARGLPDDDTTLPVHLIKFRKWLQFHAGAEGFATPESLVSLDDAVTCLITKRELENFPDVRLALELANNMKAIFDGREEPLSVMMRGGLLDQVYETGIMVSNMNDKIQFIGWLLGHKNPNMRILEIGAGTGGATVPFLDGLSSLNGQQNYSSYTFTDISPGFFENAKLKISSGKTVDFRTLDIEKDPSTQGLSGTYNLIIAANVLHATCDMEMVMKHVRSLLSDGGRLILAELSENLLAPGFLMGCLPGWWLRPRDSTTANAGLSKSEWNTLLLNTGFSELSEVPGSNSNEDGNFAYTRVMMTRAIPMAPITVSPPPSETINLMSRDGLSTLKNDIRQSLLETEWFDVLHHQINVSSPPPGNNGWFVILDMNRESLLLDLQEDELTYLQHCLSQPTKMIWVTKGSTLDPVNPTGGLVQGFMRTLRQENDKLHLITIDFDSSDPSLIASVIRDTIKRQDTDNTELELAVKEGQVHSSRIIVNSRLATQFGPPRERSISVSSLLQGRYVLSLKEVGLFKSFTFIEDLPHEVGDDDVMVEVKAVGLNSKDGDIAMGRQQFEPFGIECAGIVCHCGKDSGFRPQDRVLAMGKGTFRTFYRTSSACCKKIPDWLPFEHAAGLPFSFSTAWYALIELGRVRSGDHVLIVHGATNIGVAAAQLAVLFGAQVTTIVEDDEGQSFMERHQLHSSNILRPGSFQSTLNPESPGKFQIVLNTRMHEHQHYANALNIGGCYLQLAGSRSPEKIEPVSSSALNISIITVDIEQVYLQNTRLLGRILDQVMAYVRNKEIDIVSSLLVSHVAYIGDSFSSLVNKHNRKHVILLESASNGMSNVGITESPYAFDPQATYIIVGGLGGLGTAIAIWMACSGAQNLLLMTRTASHAAHANELIETLGAYKCHATITIGDVAEPGDVRRAICAAEYPIKGVIYAALTLSDRAFWNMTVNDFSHVFNTRVKGCYNLHNSLQAADLQFFVMLSSACGVFGNPGQSNYAGSSTFLDAFARYRHSLGLPASTIDLGFVEDIGYVSRMPNIKAIFSSRGLQSLSEENVLETVEAAIKTGLPTNSDIYDPYYSSQIIRGADWNETTGHMTAMWAKDARFRTPLYRTDEYQHGQLSRASETSGSSRATAILRDATNRIRENGHLASEESLQPMVYAAFVAKMAEILSIDVADIHPGQSIAEYGIDSLVAIQIRFWVQSITSVDIPVNDLMTTYTVSDLVTRIITRTRWNYANHS